MDCRFDFGSSRKAYGQETFDEIRSILESHEPHTCVKAAADSKRAREEALMVQEPTITSLRPRFLIESALERFFVLPISRK